MPLTIRPGPGGAPSLARLAQGYRLAFYGSGTEALSRGLALARGGRNARRPAEVILPAYGCPDLIAASEHAGLRARLVDVYPDTWGYDLEQLHSALSADTVAVLGVNLLGAGDQQSVLRTLCDAQGCQLIQDSAQYLPDLAPSSWRGDAVIFSFGRGKPLNLLRGGALLLRDVAVPTSSSTYPESFRKRLLASPAAALAFNLATHRFLYPLASRLPALKIGGTRFTPLQECHQLPEEFHHRVADAYARFRVRENYSAARWQTCLAEWAQMGISLLTCEGCLKSDTQYLRLPLLAPTGQIRDSILTRLTAAGLGASAMYQAPLNRIQGVPESIRQQGPFAGAEAFAARLFTLPTHDDVNNAVIERTRREIRLALRRQ